jgi:predicted phosphoadenosine phosphosulfate sulfurtransferase
MMTKGYEKRSVYDALQERFDYLFHEFDNIYVSFSGGKDSGVLLNLLLDFKRMYYPERRIGVFHQDFEAQYSMTTEYVTRTFKALEGECDLYWVCLPMATRTALSSYEMYWYPWDDRKEELWVRPRPDYPYVITLKQPFNHYRYRMHQEDLAKQFGRFYKETHNYKNTVCLLGVRADESLQRYSSIVNKKYGYNGECWISKQFKNVWCASPLYDWSNQDVWVANYRFNYDYNALYDLYYKAGLKIDQMRVASPFNDYSKDSLNLYRVIDPEIWTKLVGRVRGANFGCIYGKTKAMGYRSISLPEGHTWESYTKFLLDTLPARLRNNYVKKFKSSIEFWHKTGGGLDESVIKELIDHGYNIRRNGVSNYTLMKNSRIIFMGAIPDHTDDIKSTKDIPSWKRMCYCILKNDHTCRFMGFAPTRKEQLRIDKIKRKYGEMING